MAQYNKEIKKWLYIVLDKYIIYNEYKIPELDLSIEEMYILMRWDDGITMSEFLQIYGYERKKGQNILHELMHKRLIEKIKDPQDARKRMLFRTELGKSYEKQLTEGFEKVIDKLLSDLTLNEEKSVLKFISKIYQLTQSKFELK